MQLRMSPGGSICNSSRRRPELPPSSETVTIADRLSIQIGFFSLADETLQTAEQCGKTCTAADGDELLTTCGYCLVQAFPCVESYLNWVNEIF